MSALEILIQTISFGNELLLPLTEPVFLQFDLLCEALPQHFFLLLEFRIIQLSRTCLAKFSGFHLLGAVSFVVHLFGGVDKIEHVRPDQDRSQFLEIAMFLVLHLCDAPRVLTSFEHAAVVGLHILFRSDHRKWHSFQETPGVVCSRFIVLLQWRLIDFDALRLDNSSDLSPTVSKQGRQQIFGAKHELDV